MRALPAADLALASVHDRVASERLESMGRSDVEMRVRALIRQQLPDGETFSRVGRSCSCHERTDLASAARGGGHIL
jgi:hypothetical protein